MSELVTESTNLTSPKRNKRRKRLAIVVGAAILVAAGGGTAYAYWSAAGGTGTGTATSATGTASLAVTQTTAPVNLAPGVAAGTISGSIKNNANNSAYVTSVTVSIASVTKAGGAPAGTCDSTDYTLSNPIMTVGSDIAAGATAPFTGATLGFNDKVTNQDACKGATVNLSYLSS
jgi:hypothetical protein